MKIGIMGGTFDPVHNGHLTIAEYAYKEFDLDKIWFMPNGIPPHKSNPDIIRNTGFRVEMTKLAISKCPYFELCTYETEQMEPSYSYKTLEYFRKSYPADTFFFIIGADSLFAFETWKYPARILNCAIILAAYRDNVDLEDKMSQQIQYLMEKYDCDIRLLRTPLIPVSSSEIRSKVKSGLSIQNDVPEAVEEYIYKHHLYQVQDES